MPYVWFDEESNGQFAILVEDPDGIFLKEEDGKQYSILSDQDTQDPIRFIGDTEENLYSAIRGYDIISKLNVDLDFLSKKFFVYQIR